MFAMRQILTIIACLAALVLAGPAGAAELSPQDRATIAKLEEYFNGIRTMQARFLQVSSRGAMAQGTLSISRPGRMRFEYDPPSPVLLVADGIFLIFQDNELEQTTHVPLGTTPLSVLVEDPLKLTADFEVLQIARSAGVIRILMRMRSDPDAGMVQMTFSDSPIELKQWTITDAQGVEVKVALLETRRGMELDGALFKARDFGTQPTDR